MVVLMNFPRLPGRVPAARTDSCDSLAMRIKALEDLDRHGKLDQQGRDELQKARDKFRKNRCKVQKK